jgi:methyltransferase (TIGR00027 family)
MHIKIGDLAKKAGLTVRTLHHYDHIGLLSPSLRSENGYRLYSQDDVTRLQRIQALKQFGCSLEEIKAFLNTPQASLTEVIGRQIALLTRQIEAAQDLRKRLSRLNEQILRGDAAQLLDWLAVLEVMSLYKKRFSARELDVLHGNKIAGNLDRKWRRLIAEVRKLLDQKVPVSDDRVRHCARQWRDLVAQTTGNDPVLAEKLKTLHLEEPKVRILTGITLEMGEYMKQAREFIGPTTGPNPSDNRQTATDTIAPPKPTAFRVAQLRAVHQILDRPLIFEDPFAERILGGPVQEDLSRFNEPLFRGIHTSVVLRSRFAEDEWKKSYAMGLRQYVTLGAGLDTIAFKFGHLPGLKIFEVDLPETQAWKRECLQAAGMVQPPSLSFVPMDFETVSLDQRLAEAGFFASSPAFFAWLGVTMYIDSASIFDTLQFISSCARKSTVIFDYCVDPAQLSPSELKTFEIISRKVREQGELWKTTFDPASLVEKLRSFGFATVEDFGPEILNERYLSDREDGLRKSGVTRFVRAEI